MAVSNDDICHSKARSKSALKMPPASLTEAAVALLCPLITKCVFLRVIFSTVMLYCVEKVRGTKGKGATCDPIPEPTSCTAEKPAFVSHRA